MNKRKLFIEELPFAAADALDRLGQRVSAARRQRRWTQADLAAKSQTGLTTVAEIERGSPSVQIGHWMKVLWALDQTDLFVKFADPATDETGVARMLADLPKKVRHSRGGQR